MGKFCIHFEGTAGESGIKSLQVRTLEGSKIDLTAGLFCIVSSLSKDLEIDKNKLIELVNEGIKLSNSELLNKEG